MTSISPLAVSALPTTAPASDFKVNTAWTADATTNSTTAITTAYTKYTASIDDINVNAEFVENSARDAGHLIYQTEITKHSDSTIPRWCSYRYSYDTRCV